jgi:hypothetical protein
VLAEANVAFDLNTALFTTIKIDTPDEEKEKEESREIPIVIEHTPQEATYPVSQVIAIIAAGTSPNNLLTELATNRIYSWPRPFLACN